jgi:hypothetical protein
MVEEGVRQIWVGLRCRTESIRDRANKELDGHDFATPTGIEERRENAPILGDSAAVVISAPEDHGKTERESNGLAGSSSGVEVRDPKPDEYASLVRTRELAAASGEWDFVAKVQAEIDALRLARAGENVVTLVARRRKA